MQVVTQPKTPAVAEARQSRAAPSGDRGQASTASLGLWLLAALAFNMLFTARTMGPAFAAADVIQDDARQHVFWMLRFRDPELFPNDVMADYFQSLSPPGYSALYWLLSWVIDPLTASKLLPPILGLIGAVFTFLLVRQLRPSPVAAFLATVLLGWYVWQYSDLPSATPRAFMVPLLPALAWAVVTDRLKLAVTLVGLLALVYPSGAVLGVALLGVRLVRLRKRRPTLTADRAYRLALFAAAGLALVLLLPSQLLRSRFGPVVTAEQARSMPGFGPHGRHPFFSNDPLQFWVLDTRSGLDARVTDVLFPDVPILFVYLALGSLLPMALLLDRRLPRVQRLSGRSIILAHLLLASFGLFVLAHLVLFRLYIPSRYVKWSVPLVLAAAAGLALAILIEAVVARMRPQHRPLAASALTLALAAILALYPAHYDGGFKGDPNPDITAYLRTQPKDILVAGVPADMDSMPTFSGRRVLTNREYLYDWHLGYYEEMKQRTDALIQAYYADSLEEIADFADRYGIDFFVVHRAAFRTNTHVWGSGSRARWEPFTSAVIERLQEPGPFVLLDLTSRCRVFGNRSAVLVPTSCLRSA